MVSLLGALDAGGLLSGTTTTSAGQQAQQQQQQPFSYGLNGPGVTYSASNWISDIGSFHARFGPQQIRNNNNNNGRAAGSAAVSGSGGVLRTSSIHYYALNGCRAEERHNVWDLVRSGYLRWTDEWVAAARSAGVIPAVGEGNSVTCGGRVNVSDTLTAALWGVDTMLSLASGGMRRFMLHGGPSYPYTPLELDASVLMASSSPQPQAVPTSPPAALPSSSASRSRSASASPAATRSHTKKGKRRRRVQDWDVTTTSPSPSLSASVSRSASASTTGSISGSGSASASETSSPDLPSASVQATAPSSLSSTGSRSAAASRTRTGTGTPSPTDTPAATGSRSGTRTPTDTPRPTTAASGSASKTRAPSPSSSAGPARVKVKAPYYAALVVTQATGGAVPADFSMSCCGSRRCDNTYVRKFAFRSLLNGDLRVVLVNRAIPKWTGPWWRTPMSMQVMPPPGGQLLLPNGTLARIASARWYALTGPSATAAFGLSWAGATFDGSADGSPTRPQAPQTLQPYGGSYYVSLPASSAGMLVLSAYA